MNDLTRKLACEFLKSKEAWEPVKSDGVKIGYKPNKKFINEQITLAREVLFYDDVYYPHLKRFMQKVMAWNIFPGEEWDLVDMGYEDEIPIWWPLTSGNLFYIEDIIGDRLQIYLERIWDSDEWMIYELNEDELLSFGIVPDEVAVQPALI